MKSQSFALLAVPLLALAACGDNEAVPDANRNRPPDARPPDARPPDAPQGSTVMVTAGPCAGTPDFDLRTVAGPAFQAVGGGPMNPSITISAGDRIHFQTTAGMHNFASAAGTDPRFQFRSGALGPHEACLTFTQATPAAITYRCEMHASMTGSLDVN